MAVVSLFSMMQQSLVDQVFLIREHTHTHTHTTGQDSSAGVIIPTQGLLVTNYSQNTDIRDTAGFKASIQRNEQSQAHALDRVATGIGVLAFRSS